MIGMAAWIKFPGTAPNLISSPLYYFLGQPFSLLAIFVSCRAISFFDVVLLFIRLHFPTHSNSLALYRTFLSALFSPSIGKHSSLFFPGTFFHLLAFLAMSCRLICVVLIFESSNLLSHSNSLTLKKKGSCLPLFLAGRKVHLQKPATVRFHLSLGEFLPKSVVSMSESSLGLCSCSTAILAFQNCSKNWALLGEVRQYRRLSSPFTEQNDLCLHSPFLSLSFLGEEQ